MKRIFLSLAFLSSLLALEAQQNVYLHILPKAASEDFAMGNTYTSNSGDAYKPTRLHYYISLPSVTHDGGQVTDASSRYFLLDASEEIILDLGEMTLENVEGVTFSVGVDEARNHLDPAGYPPGHPLAPQNPNMHWGWTAGYIFLAFEGDCGSNFLYSFQVHSIGDELYKTVNVPTGAEADGDDLVITIVADYNRLLDGIDISDGPISHGSLGPASLIMDNVETIVFSPLSPSSTREQAFQGTFFLSPNPSSLGSGQANLVLPEGASWQLTVADLTGRVLSSRAMEAGYSAQELDVPAPGMYLVQVRQNGVPVATQKWVVTE